MGILTRLGNTVTRKPWLIIAPIIAVTLLLASALPTLRFNTSFNDFAPDNPLTLANNRIQANFGTTQHLLFLHLTTTDNTSLLSPTALRQQYNLLQTINTTTINTTVGIATLINAACQLTFNTTLNNATDSQIQTVITDLFTKPTNTSIPLLTAQDPNESPDTHPTLGRPRTQDALDIKNATLTQTNTTLIATIQVYNLKDLPTSLKPPLPRTHLLEWYLAFTNNFTAANLTLNYQLAARIQPTRPLWIFGDGILHNLQRLRQTRAERDTYNASVYLWVEVPGLNISFPTRLNNSTVIFDRSTGNITITASRKELSLYGIAPSFGVFKLPARLTNFSAGSRIYAPPLFKCLGGRLAVNTTTLLNRIQSLQNRPILGRLLTRILDRLGLPANALQNLSNTTNTVPLPSTFSLADIQSRWTPADQAPDTGRSTIVVPLLPPFFAELGVNILSFIPTNTTNATKANSTIVLAFLQPTNTTEEIATVTQEITGLIQNNSEAYPDLSIYVTGPDIVSNEINQVALDANMIIVPLIFIIILIILFIAFRRLSYVVLPILVFVLSTIWLFGTMAWLRIDFNIIAVAIVPLNIGLGVEYSVNLLYNYRFERQNGNPASKAIYLSIKEVGTAIFLAWATTFVAFISFLSATIPPVRTFGLFLALGISYTFIISMTFLMASRYLTDQKAIYKPRRTSSFSIQEQLSKIARFLLRHDKAVFAAAVGLSLVMVVGIVSLESGFSLEQFIPQDNKALRELTSIAAEFPFASQDQVFVLIEGNVATVQTVQGIRETEHRIGDDKYVARDATGVAKTSSIYDLMQSAIADNQSVATVYNVDPATGVPRNDSDVARFYAFLLNSSIYGIEARTVLYENGTDNSATLIRIYVDLPTSEDMTEEFKTLQAELEDDLTSYGDATAIVTGEDIITFTIISSLTESQLLSTGICFVLAAIMLIIVYRRPSLGLVSMIPVSLSMIWVLGTMYFIGYTLNVLTITVTSITIGVGIDYAVYITERFRLVVDRTGDIDQAVIESISRTGSGVSIAAVSSIFGFGVLFFAPIPPQQQFGVITAITLVYSIATSIFILPLILARWAKWRRKRVGYIISPGPPKEE